MDKKYYMNLNGDRASSHWTESTVPGNAGTRNYLFSGLSLDVVALIFIHFFC